MGGLYAPVDALLMRKTIFDYGSTIFKRCIEWHLSSYFIYTSYTKLHYSYLSHKGTLLAKEFWQFKYLCITIRGTIWYWIILIAVISCPNSKLLNHNVVVKGSSIKTIKTFFPHTSWCTSNLRASAICVKAPNR